MAGIALTDDRRTQLLETLLSQQANPNGQPILHGAALAAKLGEQLIRKKKIDQLRGEEKAAQDQLVEALKAGQPGQAKAVTLEDFEGGSGRQQVVIPGKKADRGAEAEALSNLSPQQQLIAMQLKAGQKELAEPTASEAAKIEFDRRQALQAQGEEADLERAKVTLSARAEEAEKDRIAQETNAIRQIQSRFALENVKQAAADDGVKLTERQGKATSWLNQMTVGNRIVEEKMSSGYIPNSKSVALYAEAIDENTGNINRQVLRKAGLSQDDINFFDAGYLVIDPVVRQSTGAAVKPFEFINWFNALIPQSDDPTEIEQKSFIRSRLINGFEIEAGPEGKRLLSQIEENNPIPKFEGNRVSINGNDYEVGQQVESNGRKGIVNADGTITLVE